MALGELLPWLLEFEVMFGWPMTTFAEALLEVGMVLRMRTRLLWASATNSLVPSETTPKAQLAWLAIVLPAGGPP